jgi:hypothetical protein
VAACQMLPSSVNQLPMYGVETTGRTHISFDMSGKPFPPLHAAPDPYRFASLRKKGHLNRF